jgi:hypothetical protein
MYKIQFDPTQGRWIILVQNFWPFWRRVKTMGDDKSFVTLADAEAYVQRVGLSQMYAYSTMEV